MDGRADGNHAQREHIARPDGLRTEDTEINGIVAVLLLLVLHHMAVALHGIACHESIRSKNVTQTLCLAVLNQRNVGAASGVILDTHDLLLTRLPAVKVDEAQAASVATTAATDRNVAVVVPTARFALSHRELTHRLAAVQVWIQRVPQPPNRGRDRLEHLELLVRSDVRRDFVFLNAQSSSNGIFLAVLAHAQLLLLLEPTTLAARPHAAHIFRRRRHRDGCAIGMHGHRRTGPEALERLDGWCGTSRRDRCMLPHAAVHAHTHRHRHAPCQRRHAGRSDRRLAGRHRRLLFS